MKPDPAFFSQFKPRRPWIAQDGTDNNLKSSQDRWLDAAKKLSNDPATESLPTIFELAITAAETPLLSFIFSNSPFLTDCTIKSIAFTLDLMNQGPDVQYIHIMDSLKANRKKTININDLSRILRVAKQHIALTVAVADFTGTWPLEKITRALSDFASLALSLSASHLLRDASEKGAFKLQDLQNPEKQSGLIILAMGKLGAYELNYSSDIDIIVMYDPDRIITDAPEKLQNHFVRLTRGLVQLMDERTVHGYVFRTDLRLRPDPGATPIAVSVLAAETYYESLGQNWERAAMIKARPVAGDLDAGKAFLETLKPFIWRKYLDFAAIQDIHSIKRQINTKQGGTEVKALGHNIKLGIGGIREIEFFAQTQQLIWGGKDDRLRSSSTMQTIKMLTELGLCTNNARDQLAAAYEFLRTTEHRLQMINDEQTQTLPETETGFCQFSVFMEYDSPESFTHCLIKHLENVRKNYRQLFEEAVSLVPNGDRNGNLMFTGIEADPDTLQTLRSMGFSEAATVDRTIRAWHHGRHRAVRTTRSREILTEITPGLLHAIGKAADPDQVFLRFDDFLSKLPAGVQLFSMFKANPVLLSLVADILGSAPRLGNHLSRHPAVLDYVLAADFFNPPADKSALKSEYQLILAEALYFENMLDQTRRFVHDKHFQIGVQQLKQHIQSAQASKALCAVTDVVLTGLSAKVMEEFASIHGYIPGASQAIMALGKLGSLEMTAASDLDLVFLYKAPDQNTSSNGDKPLSPALYFARLSQRLINALTAETNDGKLYEIDMRLRPSGNSGPIATSFEAFIRYHKDQSWTWEHMALTRARVITAEPKFTKQINHEIQRILCRQRDAATLSKDVRDMRDRLAKEKSTSCFLSLKYFPGGLLDIEFIVQYLVLKHAYMYPNIIASGTEATLKKLHEHDLITLPQFKQLSSACRVWQNLLGYLALILDGTIDDEKLLSMPEAVKQSLSSVAGVKNFRALEQLIRREASSVSHHYEDLIDTVSPSSSHSSGSS